MRTPFHRAALIALACGSIATASDRAARIEVEPASIDLNSAGDRRQVVVTAVFADGSARDVTRAAHYRIESGTAEASPTGVVTPLRDGPGRLVVAWEGLRAEVAILCRDSSSTRPASFRLDVAPRPFEGGLQHGGPATATSTARAGSG